MRSIESSLVQAQQTNGAETDMRTCFPDQHRDEHACWSSCTHVERDVLCPRQAGILGTGFVNSWALNMYHDGTEGIGSHYDDATRFMRPITSLRLFSDSRLAFGRQPPAVLIEPQKT